MSSTSRMLPLRRVLSLVVPLALAAAGLVAGPAAPADAAPRPRLRVTQAVSPTTFAHAGQGLTWTSVVTNFGDTALTDLAVVDASTRLSVRRCTPVSVGGTLAAGASTTCTATLTVSQSDVDEGATRTDAVTATATAAGDGAVQVSATATASSTPTAAPGLALTATTSPTTVSRPTQPVAYTFVARNKGNQTLSDLVVSAAFPGLSALVCAPVALGGRLAPGATTSCRATRPTTPADLGTSTLSGTARASARTKTKAVGAVASVAVAVRALPPVATDDSLSVVDEGGTFVLEGSHDDRPGEPGGAAIDPSRTVLVGTGVDDDGKDLYVGGVTFSVRPDGRVQVELLDGQSSSETVTYGVFDLAGRSATATLTVTVLDLATAVEDRAVTKQGRPVTTDVLENDDPGQRAGGGQATLDPASVRLTGVPFDGPGYATVAPGGRTLTVPFVGTYAVDDAGAVRFTPVPGFTGDSTITYAATSSNTSTAEGTLVVTVVPVAVANATLVTAYGRAVVFPAGSAEPVAKNAVLVGSGVDPGGKSLVTGAGTWTVLADGSVRMAPASGYAGTSAVRYALTGGLRPTVVATLTLTVRTGPKTVPVKAATAVGARVTLTPLTGDTPGQRLDGSTAAFTPSSLALLSTGLPTGSMVTDDGRRLTVPGQGIWTVDAASGVVAFTPGAAFVGQAATVTYRVRDDGGSTVGGRLAVAVAGSAPVATDDLADTLLGVAVRLPGATDDRAGAAAITPNLTVLPADGQPVGSSRSADGKTLTVPGQGTWSLSAAGVATFSPTPTFVGTTSPAAYAITDTAGATSRASLRVLVQPGPVARPDAVGIGLPVGNVADAAVADNDLPGRSANGSLGTIDPASVLLVGTGLADGWTVRTEGTFLQYSKDEAVVFAQVDPATGVIHLDRLSATGPLRLSLRYTVRDTVTDAAGAVVHRTTSSTLQIDVLAIAPTATDDEAATTTPFEVTLPASANDVPGDAGVPIGDGNVRQTAWPTEGQPPGSTIDDVSYPSATITVPGEGVWSRAVYYGGSVTFVPERGFVGRTTPVRYSVVALGGGTDEGTLSVTVRRGPTAQDDTGRTPRGVPTTVDVVANDDPGLDADGSRATFDRGVVLFEGSGQPAGARVSPDLDQVTVPGQGRYSVQQVTGDIVFAPVLGFTGAAGPVRFRVRSLVRAQAGFVLDSYLDSYLRITVDPVTPTAHADTAATTVGRPVVVGVLDNDTAGVAAVPLVPTSVRLRLTDELPAGSALSGDTKTLTVAGRGVFLVAGDGDITFVPLGTTTGRVPTVGYSVADTNGTTARSTLVVTVGQR